MRTLNWRSFLLLGSFLISTLSLPAAAANSLSEAEAEVLGGEAFTYLYPLVTMEITRLQLKNHAPGTLPGSGPANHFSHMRAFPDANFRAVVRPNFDTLYSSAWLDLSREPMILSVPETDGRYYLMPILDMWSDVFAVPGKRTTGTGVGHFAIVPPGWSGKLPPGVARIQAPTVHAWVIGRTQTNGPADYAAVHKVQDDYRLTPLSRWGKKPAPMPQFRADPNVDLKTPPLEQVNGMPIGKYLQLAAEVMKANPPHLTDYSQIVRLKRLGLEAGKSFDWEKLNPAQQAAVEKGAKAALRNMFQKLPTLARVVNGWQMNTDTMGVYGNYYLKRAIVAMVGLGANQVEDAIYPMAVMDADGKPTTGDRKYVLHFEKSELPPVSAFWSITMYDQDGFQVANPLNRFAIGDRDALKFNADGSLDLYFQATSPGRDLESNWLPGPSSGQISLTMRLYGPAAQALDGRWNPPSLRRR